MKNIKLIFPCLLVLSLLACTNKSNEEININFGAAIYKEPFRGILHSQPKWLLATLDYPPCSWLKPDTAFVAKSILVEFNEDAVRSKSTAIIRLSDNNSRSFANTQWYCNDELIHDGTIHLNASSQPQQLNLKAKIHPSAGNKKFEGCISIISNDIDEANTIKLSEEDINSIGDIKFTHEYGWPIILWLVWLIMALLIIAIIAGLIYFLIYLFSYLFESFSAVKITPTAKTNYGTINTGTDFNRKTDHKSANHKDNNHKEPNRTQCPCCNQMTPYKSILNSPSSSIAQKCQALLKLVDEWETFSEETKQTIYNQLCPKIKTLLDSFWDDIKKPSPTNNGHWVGQKGHGVFYFDSDFIPPEKNNRNNMTWKELVDAYKKDFNLHVDGGIHFYNGRIDLKPYAIALVKVRYEDSNLTKLRQRGGESDTIQEIGAKLFEKKLRKLISEKGYDSFWGFKDGICKGEFVRNTPLVIHEDYDGETLMLVPKYLHDNWKHYGGIALIDTIYKCLY